MLTLRVVQAHEGDCLLLLHGGEPILLDGGPKRTYDPHLRSALADANVNVLALAVLSHVDTDHVTGLLELFGELRDANDLGNQPPLSVRHLWMNAFGDTVDAAPRGEIRARLDALYANVAASGREMSLAAAALRGIGEGHRLGVMAKQLGVPLNAAANGKPFVADGQAPPLQIDGLQLRVVGPTQANLAALREKWEQWLEEQEDRLARGEIDVAAMSDRSIPNLSSLQLLVESGGKRLLLTGDGRGDHLLEALETAGLLGAGGAMRVDVFKVPHHGSDRNVTAKFFERVVAPVYVISANGKDGNPDPPTLKWIVTAAKKRGEKIEIVLTNKPPHVDDFEAEFPPATYGYRFLVRPPTDDFIDVTVEP